MNDSGASLDLEEDIAAAEFRIQRRKELLLAEVDKARTALRSSVTSPSALLLAVGIGFTLGRITQGERGPGQSRLSKAWLAVSGGVKTAAQLVRAPSLVWIASLLGTAKPKSDVQPATPPEDFPPV